MVDHSYIMFLYAGLFILCIAIILLFRLLNRKTKEIKRLTIISESIDEIIEQRVRSRTKQLELIRDSVSEYAVQKFELAQELEIKNRHIIEQKDDIQKKKAKLREAYEEIKKLDSFKYQMTRMIIHDLKNPLNILVNIVDTMDVPSKPAGLIKQISYEMLELILNILDVNKFKDSKMNINYENFELSVLLKKVVEKYSVIIINPRIQLKISIPEPCTVNSDFRIIERVIDNLLGNAIKHSKSGGSIEIAAFDLGDKVRIEIRDKGQGIPEELLDTIFDEYVNGLDGSFKHTNSTGIGLTYCKLAIEAQGGEIGLSSKQGEGTTVWFLTKKGFEPNVMKFKIYEWGMEADHSVIDLSSDDIVLIRPILDKIRETSIYEGSAILLLLGNEIFNNNERLLSWKEYVETAVFSADEKLFATLINI